MIDTHQELVLVLSEAAELEHSLICQYLFAAYSIKTEPDEISEADAQKFIGWQERILTIAHQEMGHLGTVWNLAALAGASGNAQRANFPQQPGKYYPPEIGFFLERFGIRALDRFIDFEKPIESAFEARSVAPDPLIFTRVGDLYRQIRTCVETLNASELLVNPQAGQDSAVWSGNVTPRTATTRDEALAALDFIIEQGEGSTSNIADSHFGLFTAIRAELEQHIAVGGVDPARPSVTNLVTHAHRDAPDGVIINEPLTARAIDLFNLLYATLLVMLRQFYAFAGETADERKRLRRAATITMRSCLAPLGRALSRMPAWSDGRDGTGGASFELYGFEMFSTDRTIAWALMARRIRTAENEARSLAAAMPSSAGVLTEVADSAAGVATILESPPGT